MSTTLSPAAEKTPSDDFNKVIKSDEEKRQTPPAQPAGAEKTPANTDRYIPGPYDFWGP